MSDPTAPAVTVRGLRRQHGGIAAVDGIDLGIRPRPSLEDVYLQLIGAAR